MPATLDLTAVRRFTDELTLRIHRCDSDEGMICSTLDASINYYNQICGDLRMFIGDWGRAVFAGQVVFDPETENQLRYAAWRLLQNAKPLAARARAMDAFCYVLDGLNALHYHVEHFSYLLDNWVSPRPAVSPAPRVTLSDAAKREITESLAKLSTPPRT